MAAVAVVVAADVADSEGSGSRPSLGQTIVAAAAHIPASSEVAAAGALASQVRRDMLFAALPRQKGLSMVHTAVLLGSWSERILASVAERILTSVAAAVDTAKVVTFVAEQQELEVVLIPSLAASQAVPLCRGLVAW